ncbi:hypothetical protein [Roseicella sp. DB1501]|uniref:hypothetical protein n=1 Tax=Roseicella sp. DB1501 TaxID=2730925 RepID=UPI0014927199|nr:hypothetical protein [Roseicella sp. DB1501]NOG69830.1 hypothetical protein [Roseicella sp. DB1501]
MPFWIDVGNDDPRLYELVEAPSADAAAILLMQGRIDILRGFRSTLIMHGGGVSLDADDREVMWHYNFEFRSKGKYHTETLAVREALVKAGSDLPWKIK